MHKKQHIISLIVCICVLLGCFSYYPSVSAINASSNEATEATQKDFCGLSIDETTGNSEDTSETTVLPDFITSDQIKSDKIVRRITSEESNSSIVIENDEGNRVLYQYPTDIKFVNGEGKLVDKSVCFEEINGGFVPKSLDIDIVFPYDLSKGIEYKYDDYSFILLPEDNSAKAYLSEDKKEIEYRINDSLSFVYALHFNGTKENIILKEYTGRNSFSYSIISDTLNPCIINKELYLCDRKNDTPIFSLGDVFVSDTSGKNNIIGEIEIDNNGNNRYTIKNIIPEAYLTSKERVYPVYIDPPITVVGASNIDDVTIGSIGGMESLSSGSLYAGLGNVDGKLRFLMKFKALSESSLYMNLNADDILSATINLRDVMCYGDKQIDLSLNSYANGYLPATWTNGCMSWSSVFSDDDRLTQIGSALTVYYGHGNGSDGIHWYAFDATQLVKNWKSGSAENNVAVFRTPNSTETGTLGDYLVFGSSDRVTNNPYLTIVCNTTISNGVYAIKNKATGRYLISDTYLPNVRPTCASVNNPCYTVSLDFDSRCGLFKITNTNDKLIIRTMMSNELFLQPQIAIGVNEIVTSLRVYDDNSVQNNEKWGYFRDMSDGYYSIFFYDTSISSSMYYIAAYSDGTVGLTTIFSDNCKFLLQKYKGLSINRIVTINTIPQKVEPNGLFEINSVISSTTIGSNGPAEYALSPINPDGTTTQRANIYAVGWYHYITANLYNYHSSFTLIISYSNFIARTFNVEIKYYGYRFYEQQNDGGTNCLEYAFLYNMGSDSIIDSSLHPVTIGYYSSMEYQNDDELLNIMKASIEFELGSRCVDVTNQGGINTELNDGEWLVAMRVGTEPFQIGTYNNIPCYCYGDYHFWYRTASGEWANKHGSYSSVPLGSDLPTNNNSSGWKLHGDDQYYTSSIVYYKVTQTNN